MYWKILFVNGYLNLCAVFVWAVVEQPSFPRDLWLVKGERTLLGSGLGDCTDESNSPQLPLPINHTCMSHVRPTSRLKTQWKPTCNRGARDAKRIEEAQRGEEARMYV